MNIIYDDTIFNIQKYGGVSRYFSKIIGLLKKDSNVNIEIARTFWVGLPWKLRKLNDILLSLRLDLSRSDVYHPTYYSNLVKKRSNVKTVVTVYDMIHELYAHKFTGLNSGIEIKKTSILNADHIICISNNCKKDLQNFYGIKNDCISVIYLGVCLSRANTNEDMNKKAVYFKKQYILYVGNRKYHK